MKKQQLKSKSGWKFDHLIWLFIGIVVSAIIYLEEPIMKFIGKVIDVISN